jgi:hypothetical protein
MLVIRDTQMRVFGRLRQDAFEQELTAFFLQHYPREARQAGGAEQIGVFVRRGVAGASEFGFTTRREVRIFVTLMLMLGADFPRDVQIPWAAEGLQEASFPDATLRCEQLFRTALAYLGATAGKRGELIVRAILRVRALDLGTVPTTRDAGWAPAVGGIWRRLYPEKFDYQGEAVCLDVIDRAAARAPEYGLFDPVGVFVHATLMFYLGIGYDSDPLHPWAAAVLTDQTIPKGPEVGQRLHAAAMAHLEQSLTSS